MGEKLNALLRLLELKMLRRHFLTVDSVFEVDKPLIALWINKLRHRSSCSWLKSPRIKQSLLQKKKEHQALHFEIIVDENQVPNYNQVVTS